VRVEKGVQFGDLEQFPEWQPNTEPDLAGYEIVFRDTTSPYWQRDVGARLVRTNKDESSSVHRRVDLAGARAACARAVEP
jgi:hypothetical protein